jgi:hypothetical protein
MLARRPDLPRHMEGGPQNPLGARAMYLGSSLYRIHGSNEPWTIGTNVSSGCIRMRNEDVIDLIAIFDLANLSSAVHVLTEDLGRVEPGGLRLLGRAPGADLRGCSLTVEEMAGG